MGMKNEHEHFVDVLMDMAKSVEGEKNAFDLYDILLQLITEILSFT